MLDWTFCFCLGVDFPEVFAAAFSFLKSEWELIVNASNFVFEEVEWIHYFSVFFMGKKVFVSF